jgi:hypothetical protein
MSDFTENALDLTERLNVASDLPTDVKNVDEFKSKIASFITRQLGKIEGLNALQEKVVRELAEKVDRHELSVGELMGLLSSLGNQKSTSTAVLLDIFKPTPGSVMTPLLMEKKEETKDELDDVFKNLSSDNKMAMLNIFLKIAEASKIVKEGETEL